MSVDLRPAIVRILNPRGITVGTGFILSEDGLVATCAHVVEAAGAGPGSIVSLVFHTAGQERQATVETKSWRGHDAEDLAVLRIEGKLPKDVQLLPLGPSAGSKGHSFETFGFPEASPQDGILGTGKVLGETTIGGVSVLQLRSPEVTPGFSGAPVWDQTTRRVVGIVTAITPPDEYGRLGEVAFITPIEALVKACPELEYIFQPGVMPADVGRPAEAIVAVPVLQSGARLDLQGKSYLIRDVIAQRVFGSLVVRTARASDVSMGRDVGIRQVEALTDTPEAQASLRQVMIQAQTIGQAASRCEHIPQVYGVVDQGTDAVWVIAEWIRGVILDQLLPQNGPVPDVSALRQLLGWAADVCDALSAIHHRRVSHAGISARTILVTRSQRGAVLIDPGFINPPGPLAAEPPPFDPATDVRDLAETVYRLVTHRPPQTDAASAFNPIVPPAMDGVLRDALSGSIGRADLFKCNLLAAKRALRSL